MTWQVVLTTFATVFLAELGDKTQLATFSLASGRSRLAVFVGASLALMATTAIAVLAGEAIARVVPQVWIERSAGVLFLALGGIMLFRSW